MKLKLLILLLFNSQLLFSIEYSFSNFGEFIKKTRDIKNYEKINEAISKKEIEKVAKLFEDTINLKRDNVFLDYLFLGDFYSKYKNKDKAIYFYRKSLDLNDKIALIYIS